MRPTQTKGRSRKAARPFLIVTAIYAVSFCLDAGPGWLLGSPKSAEASTPPLLDRRRMRTADASSAKATMAKFTMAKLP